ncbi:MAG: flagellar biosynthesis protein FlhF [Pseudomonadota bacterium]
MRIKRFIAPDMRTALKLVREEHGPDAVILSNRAVHGGIEVVAATDYDEALVQQALRNAAEPAPAPSFTQAAPAPAAASEAHGTVVQARESRGTSRADAMIAALAGSDAATRSAVAERARAVARQDGASRTPALSALLRKPAAPPVEATAGTAGYPATADAAAPTRPGDDFRALLARLNEAEEPAPTLSAHAGDLARTEATPLPSARDADAADDEATPAPAVADFPEFELPAGLAREAFAGVAMPAAPQAPDATPDADEVRPAAPTVAARSAPRGQAASDMPPPAASAASTAQPVATIESQPAPTFAELLAPTTPAVAATPAPAADAFDALAEMAAVQAPARTATAAPVALVAPPTLQVVVSQSEDPTIIAMRNELASMRQMIERQMGQFAIERLRGSPARALAFETLQGYGCDDALAQQIATRIDPRLDANKVKPALLAEFARMLTITREEPIEDGGVFALIGPTGAGKTTTLAKLAARFAQRHRARDVALVTTDIERPGAREQLHALGRRLGITVCEADGPEGLTDALDQLVDYPLVLVDTAGYAARDKALLGQVTWLRATRGMRSLLVLPAHMQPQDMAEAVRRYRMAQPEAVLLTKLDETGRLGGALSVAVRHGLSLAYTTAGQQVPADLEAADASRLVLALEKLRRAADNPLATEERHVVA